MISIGAGRNVDFAELEAIASYPKRNNALFPIHIGYDRALNLTLKQVDKFLLGKLLFLMMSKFNFKNKHFHCCNCLIYVALYCLLARKLGYFYEQILIFPLPENFLVTLL